MMRSMMTMRGAGLLLLFVSPTTTHAFGISPDLVVNLHHGATLASTGLPAAAANLFVENAAASSSSSHVMLSDAASSSSSSITTAATSLYAQYQTALQTNPLGTKMMTGAILAVLGDGIAQAAAAMAMEADEVISHEEAVEHWYDAKRAGAFMTFDAAYRAAQHVLYPPMCELFRGQYLWASVAAFAADSSSGGSTTTAPLWAAAFEQAWVSQLVIIPLVYYPFFFAITGMVQGLTVNETVERARTTFVPLMKRNLLFWVPVQFAVFGFVTNQDLQIPILTLCGLVWTIILSIVAGSVAQDNVSEEDAVLPVSMAADDEEEDDEEDVYCITGMESNCLIDPDDLFRPPHHHHHHHHDETAAPSTDLSTPTTTTSTAASPAVTNGKAATEKNAAAPVEEEPASAVVR